MATILLLETATERCSVGLATDGQLIALREADEVYQHAARITLLIEETLSEAGQALAAIDAIALSSGPGSYTSLRVGTSTAKGIGFALQKPLIAVDTLAALARAARHPDDATDTLYIPMIDARRMEVYTAIYDHQGQELLSPHAAVIQSDSFAFYRKQGHPIVFCGNGAEKCQSVLSGPDLRYRTNTVCSAAHLSVLAEQAFEQMEFKDLAYYEPHYLKPPNVTRPRSRL